MTLRRLPVAASLALLVAVLAHWAEFGTEHVLGGKHGATLLYSALAALIALALGAAFGVALGGPAAGGSSAAAARLRAALPGGGELGPFAAWLFGGALSAFAGLELLEGHAPAAATWILPLAALAALGTAWLGRVATRWLAVAGLALAALGGELARALGPRLAPIEIRLTPAGSPGRRGARRGRAPPRRG